MSTEDVVLHTKDCNKRVVIFHRGNYDKHKRKHPELEDAVFFPPKVKNALKNPTFTIPGNGNSTTCYYVEEFSFDGIIKYTKVVVLDECDDMDGQDVYHIMTAFKTDHVQEEKYPDLTKQMYFKGAKI